MFLNPNQYRAGDIRRTLDSPGWRLIKGIIDDLVSEPRTRLDDYAGGPELPTLHAESRFAKQFQKKLQERLDLEVAFLDQPDV
jgi:hypothetical protein